MRALLRLLLCLLAGLSAVAAEVNVFAAASLSAALQELVPIHEARTGDRLGLNLGASSTLARQIREGAPADLFFSADEAKMDDLERAGLLAPGTRRTLLSNTLVIVVHADGGAPVTAPADLATGVVRRLALAEVQSVPAGIYARAYLQKLGLWDQVRAKVVALENVRSALAAVEAGNAEAGIVYRTDALASRKVRVAFAVPAAEGPAIAYPLAVMRDARNAAAARRLAAFLASDEARAVYVRHGFLPAGK